MLYLEDVNIGDAYVFQDKYLVTEEEIIEVGERWDPQPFHVDPVAAKASIFGGLVASSAHLFSIWIRIGHADIDKDQTIASVSALGFNNLQWHAPVRPNDVLGSGYEILEIRESRSKPELGIVTTANTVTNQDELKVFTLECTFLVPRKGSGIKL